METHSLITSFFLVFTGAAVFATAALYTRQPLLVAYVAFGMAVGPHGSGMIKDLELLAEMSHIGIIFLLFLLGLDMQPRALLATLGKALHITLISSFIFAIIGWGIGKLFGFANMHALVIGIACMFSSTIISIKLLPTTVLHHRHTGELMVGILLAQDLLAIIVLITLLSGAGGYINFAQLGKTFLSLPAIVGFCFLSVRFLLNPIIAKFDRFHEYIFLLAIGWCLGIAELCQLAGLSREVGAFLAGITLATSPISQYIALHLKPLRDFFLVLFFFALGARFNLALVPNIALGACTLALIVLLVKPLTFRWLLGKQSENQKFAWGLGLRLGQTSEFSLLIAFVAANAGLISEKASVFIQFTTLLTFLVSSYIVILNLQTPVAISDNLRRD